MMVLRLSRLLPARYVAEPSVHVGTEIEVDIGSYDQGSGRFPFVEIEHGLAFSPTAPTVALETELLAESEYEVRVYDAARDRRLVAAVEIVSPANKDRAEHRQTFLHKCEALLRRGVSVAIVDIVTSRHSNLYAELLQLIGRRDPTMPEPAPATYAVACRWIPRGRKHILESWSHVLTLGGALPTLPLWLAEDLAVPLELEAGYEDTCRVLRIA